MTFQKSLFVFRRDLRLEDNLGLIEALKNSEKVIPCFIFDKRQIETNSYKSENLIEFMVESLKDLKQQLKEKNAKLYFFYGVAEEVIEKLIKKEKIGAVFINRDYTAFSVKRDKKIKDIAKENNIEFFSYDDLVLNSPENVITESGKPYTIFTPYFNKASKIKVKKPEKNTFSNYYKNPISFENNKIIEKLSKIKNENKNISGGREKAIEILKSLNNYKNYELERNYPFLKKTTQLSAYLKFGCASIRETYYSLSEKLGEKHPLIKQLYWRDFYTQIAFNFPHVFKVSFKKEYSKIKWENNKNKFEKWKNGFTGFPIVDAGMRQLNKTGFMHNRVRMIVASFLVKDLHIDWRIGEKYFAQKLVDYDPSVNNGNWQWAASTGCDPQPYFRIFNPWLQQIKFDKDCKYIKEFIPELREFTEKEIHDSQRKSNLGDYPQPIITHNEESKKAIKYFKEIK